jgi:hypothetical protein
MGIGMSLASGPAQTLADKQRIKTGSLFEGERKQPRSVGYGERKISTYNLCTGWVHSENISNGHGY